MIPNRRIPAGTVLEKLDECLGRKDYDAAERHLRFWLSEAEAMNDQKCVLLIKNELMGLCRKLGKEEQALGFARSAIEQIEKMGIENNVGAATTYLNCATVCKAFGKAQDSIPLFERARAIYEQNLPPDDDRFGGLYNNMALTLVDLKRFEEADSLYAKALEVMSSIENKEPEQAITYLNMATAAEVRYGLEEAQDYICAYAEKAMELLDEGKERTDGDYAFACEKCASVFGYYGYFYYENELMQRSRRIYEGA